MSYLWQWPGAVYDIELIESMPWFAISQERVMLPIVSDPTSEDCDDDVDDIPLKIILLEHGLSTLKMIQ